VIVVKKRILSMFLAVTIALTMIPERVSVSANADFASEFAALVNSERIQRGLSPLLPNHAQLNAAAMARAQEFSVRWELATTNRRPNGRWWCTILDDHNVVHTSSIAWGWAGRSTPNELYNDILKESNENLLATIFSPEWQYIGVGYVRDPNGDGGHQHYWALIFISTGVKDTKPPPPPPNDNEICGDCMSCPDCGFRGGRYGFGRVTDTGERPELRDALQILRYLVNLSNIIDRDLDLDSFLAAMITNPQGGIILIADALQILRFLVRLPNMLDEHYTARG
jgi:uncharacterized protein YkwD